MKLFFCGDEDMTGFEDMTLDLSFLDEFDFNHFSERPEDLFSFNAILICNNQPDIQVMEYTSDTQLALYIQQEFDVNAVQTIVKNNHEDSERGCPYFRIVMEGYDGSAAINFKLQSMFQRMKIESLSPRCSKAMIIGLTTFTHLESPISVPYCFLSTNIDPIDFMLEEPELDMACLQTCQQPVDPKSTLCDIAGMPLPYKLPWECQVHILLYLRNPLAEMICHKIDDLCYTWDIFVHTMFQQREPRIPCHIASSFNASTVQSTVEDATRYFLVPCASRKERLVFPKWMKSS